MNDIYFNSLAGHGVKILSDSGNLVIVDQRLYSELERLKVNRKLFANFIDSLVEEKFPAFFWTGSSDEGGSCKVYDLIVSNFYALGQELQYFFILGRDFIIAFRHFMSESAEEFLLRNARGCNKVRMPFVIRFFPLELVEVASRLDEGEARTDFDVLQFSGTRFNILWPFDTEEVTVNVKS